MAYFHSFAVFVMLLCVCGAEYDNCATQKSDLLEALFKTDGNLYELDRVFTPARIQSSRYIKVTYSFFDADTDEVLCNVTLLWSVGGFLFIQPPRIFMFTSLLFSIPANTLTDLHLKLPKECINLINYNASTGECSCFDSVNGDMAKLDRLTQQVQC